MRLTKALNIMLIPAMIIAMLSGCTGQIKDTAAEPETGLDNDSVNVVREDEGPSQGGVLNLFMTQPDTLNPLTTSNPTVRQLSGFVFDSLFFEGDDGTCQYGLAESYVLSQDGLILDITLRDGILFHDGQPLTSDDVAFTIKTIQNAERSPYSPHVMNIENVKAVNRLDIRIVLKKADPRIIEKMIFPVLPRHVFKDWPIEGHSDTLKLVGTGPFVFDSYRDNAVKLSRNDAWWKTKTPDGLGHAIWLDGITFRVYPDESYMMEAFQKQEIDIAWMEEGENESYARREDIFYNRYQSNNLEFLTLSAIGKTGSPIGNEEFRRLVMEYLSFYASANPIGEDEPILETQGSSGQGNTTRGDILSALEAAGFTYQIDKNILFYHKDGAKIPVVLSIKYNSINGERQAVSEWVVSALLEIGIEVLTESASYSEQKEFIANGKFDMMLLGCKIPDYADRDETMELVRETLGMVDQKSVLLPLYRKYGAVIYHNRIRGLRKPDWKKIYNGWEEWYMVKGQP